MARVVVVGAGMGGLAAAARLGALRHEVTVLEQAPVVGGKLGRFERDGFAFDTGPSLLTLPAVYRDTFYKTGAPLEEVLELVPVDPAFHYRFADGTEVDVPNASRSRARQAFDDAFGDGAGADWERFLDVAHRIWQVTRGPFLESPLDRGDLLRLSRRVGDLRTVAPWRTLRGLGRRHLRDPRLRMLLDRYATYTGSDPRRAPAALAVVPYVEQAFGAWYVPGGLRRLGDALHERARATGATVRTGADVAEVLVEGGKAVGVRLADGERVRADVVVANADASHLYADLLQGPVAQRELRSLRRATPSLSGFVLLLALRGRTPGLAHHTVLFPERYDEEFDAVFGGRPPDDPTVYVSAPDDPALRPDDEHEAWFVLVNAPRHEPGRGMDWAWPGLADAYADRVLEIMAERGLDVRDRVLWRQVRTPADLERETRSPGGSIYGTSSNGARAAFLRPANSSPVPGLFLVGGSSHPGGGLPLVGLSAAIVAELVGKA
ncbi:phytoene desaturase family protein [Motilibacter aurantiacus]|uniref:phytoene desaturase family protein n=1 Tax=Motilibacter aurantiacus TaxID=2714955 RepID=UPI0014073D89|nr:phytoene desaturase [Motilibacter aurantiacus]